jgi:hypothetical protein
MDRHKIWRIVRNNYESLREASPEGYAPVIEVFLAGRPNPVRLAQVETTREPEFPWALLITETETDGDKPSPDECLILVPDHYIERIELRFERSEGRGVGFSHGIIDDSDPLSGDE